MTYDRAFYDFVSREAQPSADRTIERFFWSMTPDSVLDVGCAEGAWLHACIEQGVTDVVGIDHGAGIDMNQLRFPSEQFVNHDLSEPFNLSRRFSLALCMEVAEHLPRPAADPLVESICRHADVVLWSAAIPCQGGEGHINEQWPEYWIERFNEHGYDVSGQLRWNAWYDDGIAGFYRQNLLVFANETGLEDNPELRVLFYGPYKEFTIRVVHPVQFGERIGVRYL